MHCILSKVLRALLKLRIYMTCACRWAYCFSDQSVVLTDSGPSRRETGARPGRVSLRIMRIMLWSWSGCGVMEPLCSGPLLLSLGIRGGKRVQMLVWGVPSTHRGHAGVVDVLLVAKATNTRGWPAYTTILLTMKEMVRSCGVTTHKGCIIGS